jgi:hypothetical protein
MMFGPIVLNAFTTFAPRAQQATCSAAEVVLPSAKPERSGNKGLTASMRTFPVKSPSPCTISFVAGQGVASNSTSQDLTPEAWLRGHLSRRA